MEKTIGKKLYELRKQSGFTQDYVADKLGVSSQAVSKWENDLSCPDIMLLPQIAELYGITVDELFKSNEVQSNVKYEKQEIVDEKDLYLRVYVDSHTGDNVKVSLPYPIAKEILKVGKNISSIVSGININEIDVENIFAMVEKGVLGELVNIETQTGDIVRVVVER